MWVSKWRAQAERLQHEVIALQMMLDSATKDVEYFREREQRAVAALLDLQGKPALERPDSEAAMKFLDKSFDLFGDTQGGEEVF